VLSRKLAGLLLGAIIVAAWPGYLCAATAAKKQLVARPEPPFVLYPPCPCYHLLGQGDGNTRVDARVNLAAGERAGARLLVEVLDDSGKALQSASADASSRELVGVSLRVPIQALARFTVIARLLDRAGKELGKGTSDIHVAPAEQSRVTIAPDGFLRVAGKPEFVLGMYSAGHFPEMGQAGFNATHSYAITTGETDEPINPTDARLKQMLDNSWSNHMRMMVELPRKAIEKADWPQVQRRIVTFRHHPGLLCWGSEERVARGLTKLTNMAALYRVLKELDPEHPLVLGDTKDVIKKFEHDRSDFFPEPYMDVGIWWWYPVPMRPAQANALEGHEGGNAQLTAPAWLTTTISKKPLWIAIQSYQKPSADARFPTPAEYRCMAYLSIINGVKGLFFYTGSGQKDHEGKPSGLLNKPQEGHWDYVRKLVTELKEFSPVIMAPTAAQKLILNPTNSAIEFSTRELNGKLYILAANKSPTPQSVTFTGASLPGKKSTLLFESTPANLAGNTLSATFDPFAVHVYRLE
jgi:hypothetical protein